MTEHELQNLRLTLQIEVLKVLVRGLYTGLANTSPAAAQAYRDRFAALRASHGEIALPMGQPEYSDLIAAEYQEALEDILSFIEAGFR